MQQRFPVGLTLRPNESESKSDGDIKKTEHVLEAKECEVAGWLLSSEFVGALLAVHVIRILVK